jgi:hypothetical protein
LDQLAPPEEGELLLFSMKLREEAGATNTLSSLVAAIRDALSIDAAMLSGFENALVQLGYLPIHADEYAKAHLRVVEESLFHVKDDFPRLVAGSFAAAVPAGIEYVEYDINLGASERFVLAKSAAAPQLAELFGL